MVREIIILYCIFVLGASANTIKVPDNYKTIQAAIEGATTGDTVLVNPGVYLENINFLGKQLVVASLFLTTGDTTYISQTIIDGQRDSSTVSIQNTEPLGTALVGFSIRNGLGTGNWPNVRGGGVHIKGGQPVISYCYIYDNETSGDSNRGAGIMASTAYALISNCRIYNNTSFSGAGIWIGNGANGTIVDSCAVFNNNGGGILISYSNNVTISRSLLYGNNAYAIRNFATGTRFIHNTIAQNEGYGFLHQTTGNGKEILEIINTICFANADSFEVENDTLVQARYSIIEKADGRLWFDSSNKEIDPAFSDLQSFYLQPTSPAIDGGDPKMPYDPDNTIADIGAYYYAQPTAINEQTTSPSLFSLQQNYPNPFNPLTTIRFTVVEFGYVELKIYDLLGKKIKTLLSKELMPGIHDLQWDSRDDSGQSVSSGIYLYRLVAGKFSATHKMVLIR